MTRVLAGIALIALLFTGCASTPPPSSIPPFEIVADWSKAPPYVVRWGKLFDCDARAISADDIVVDWVTPLLEPGPGLTVEVHARESRSGSVGEVVLWFLIDDRSRSEGVVSRILVWHNEPWTELEDEPIHEIQPRVPVTYSYHRDAGRLVLRVGEEIPIPGNHPDFQYTIHGELEITDQFPEYRYYRAFMETIDPRTGILSEDEALAVVRANGPHDPYWFRAVKLLCDTGSEDAVIAVTDHLGSLDGIRFEDAFQYVVEVYDRLPTDALRREIQRIAAQLSGAEVPAVMSMLRGTAVASHAVASMVESADRDLVLATGIWLLRRGREGLDLEEAGWERILAAVNRAKPARGADPVLRQLLQSIW